MTIGSKSLFIAVSFQPVQQLADLIDVTGRVPAILYQMFHQRHGFPGEEQVDEFSERLTNHRLSAYFW